MKLDGTAFYQHGFKCLNTQPVKGGGTVQKNGMFLDHLFKNVPDLGFNPLHHSLRTLDIMGKSLLHQLLHNEGLEEFQRHFLGKAALVDLELGAYNDNRTSRIVNTLTKQVLAETSLFALQHIRKGLERTVARACNGTAAAAVVYKGINSLLEHALLVSDYDFRRAKIQQSL